MRIGTGLCMQNLYKENMSHLLSNKEVIQNILYRKILIKSLRQKSYFPMSYYFKLLHFYGKQAMRVLCASAYFKLTLVYFGCIICLSVLAICFYYGTLAAPQVIFCFVLMLSVCLRKQINK
jgi:hypothetical protein